MGIKGILKVLATILLGMTVIFICTTISPCADTGNNRVTLYFFWGEGCPHCAREKLFLEELKRKYPLLEIKSYEVFEQKENLRLFMQMAKDYGIEAKGVPATFIGGKVFAGFSAETAKNIEERVRACIAEVTVGSEKKKEPQQEKVTVVTLPTLGKIDTTHMSLPLFTVIIAGLDSLNPCAFFVLFFLLSLLIHVHSRARMLVIGCTFVFLSGLIYFFFMAAWLNLFLIIGNIEVITRIAALVALLIAAVNIKDFFFFKEGISLGIPEEAKPRLFERMREIVQAGSLPMMLAGTVVLAVAANTYELLCTAGFPMVYTRVLTLNDLSRLEHYLYLTLYNVVYIIPLAVIVVIFVVTLGSRKLTEWQGRVLKLVSGCMMLGLGVVLLVKPSLLNNALVSTALLAGTLAVSGALTLGVKWREKNTER